MWFHVRGRIVARPRGEEGDASRRFREAPESLASRGRPVSRCETYENSRVSVRVLERIALRLNFSTRVSARVLKSSLIDESASKRGSEAALKAPLTTEEVKPWAFVSRPFSSAKYSERLHDRRYDRTSLTHRKQRRKTSNNENQHNVRENKRIAFLAERASSFFSPGDTSVPFLLNSAIFQKGG